MTLSKGRELWLVTFDEIRSKEEVIPRSSSHCSTKELWVQ